jgi:hypothetical protein
METLAFILNLDPQDVSLHLETDAGRLDAGVTHHVGERLLDDAVSADLDLRRDPFSLYAALLKVKPKPKEEKAEEKKEEKPSD